MRRQGGIAAAQRLGQLRRLAQIRAAKRQCRARGALGSPNGRLRIRRGGWPPRRAGQPNNEAPASHRVVAARPNPSAGALLEGPRCGGGTDVRLGSDAARGRGPRVRWSGAMANARAAGPAREKQGRGARRGMSLTSGTAGSEREERESEQLRLGSWRLGRS
jgi:hypothetical protein